MRSQADTCCASKGNPIGGDEVDYLSESLKSNDSLCALCLDGKALGLT